MAAPFPCLFSTSHQTAQNNSSHCFKNPHSRVLSSYNSTKSWTPPTSDQNCIDHSLKLLLRWYQESDYKLEESFAKHFVVCPGANRALWLLESSPSLQTHFVHVYSVAPGFRWCVVGPHFPCMSRDYVFWRSYVRFGKGRRVRIALSCLYLQTPTRLLLKFGCTEDFWNYLRIHSVFGCLIGEFI